MCFIFIPCLQGDDVDDEIRKLTGQDDADSVRSDTVDLIHPNEVLKALRAFVEDTRNKSKSVSFFLDSKEFWEILSLENVMLSGNSSAVAGMAAIDKIRNFIIFFLSYSLHL